MKLWSHNDMFGRFPFLARGGRGRLAAQFNVSKSTISRDLAAIKREWSRLPCPLCDSLVQISRWEHLELQGKVKIKTPGKVVRTKRVNKPTSASALDPGEADGHSPGAESRHASGKVRRLPVFAEWNPPPADEGAGLGLDAPEDGMETEESEHLDEAPARVSWNFAPGVFNG
jgi:hypothetical protein